MHDLLRALGDLSEAELSARLEQNARQLPSWLSQLLQERRIAPATIGGESRWIAAEDAGLYRDALGIVPAAGTPQAFLEVNEFPWSELIIRFARTHGPFTDQQVAFRFGIGIATVRKTLQALVRTESLLVGEFRPGGSGTEWCDPEVLGRIKRRSLAALRQQIEPVGQQEYARFLVDWHGTGPRIGYDGLLDAIEQLQGAACHSVTWKRRSSRLGSAIITPAMLDQLMAAGEVVWRGNAPHGSTDGRIELYLTDAALNLAEDSPPVDDPLERQLVEYSNPRPVFFFGNRATAGRLPAGCAGCPLATCLVRKCNERHTGPLRSLGHRRYVKTRGRTAGPGVIASTGFRSRRADRAIGSEGRWSLFRSAEPVESTATERTVALVTQLLERYGIVTREAIRSESLPGGFSRFYPILRTMEESGRLVAVISSKGRGHLSSLCPVPTIG